MNASQSTNDTYPTAMAPALIDLPGPALAALERPHDALLDQARQGEGVRRLGRTCPRDAVSLTVEETHRAQATMVAFAAMTHPDGLALLAGACRHTAITLARIASDLRWPSAGPVGGPAEVLLPPLQAGSSIMPGKVNPVIPELVMQLSYRVRANAHGVESAIAAGELEPNVMAPVILGALVSSLRDIRDAAHYFAGRCVDGLRWNRPMLDRLLPAALDEFVDPATGGGYTAAARAVRARSATADTGDMTASGPSPSIE